MKTNKTLKTAGILTLAVVGSGLTNMANAAPTVRLNGQPLATSAAPIQMNGRTLVPMRDIFEALGANVNYNAVTRGIIASSGNTKVDLQIGNRMAMINGATSTLEQAPMIRRGVTYVPLRFVSEAMGANVRYNAQRQVVNIRTNGFVANRPNNGLNNGGSQVAGYRTISVPAGAVVPVTLDQEITSATARVGDRFTATVRSERLGDSEFPVGSKIEGVISEATPRTGNNPGVLDLDFRSVLLPDGTRRNISGELIALDAENVTSTGQGRIMAKNRTSKNDQLKVIGIGAGAGYLLGRVLKQDGLLSAVLGAAGGYIYNQQTDKNKAREAVLPTGAELGVKLNTSVNYTDTSNYANDRNAYLNS
jgi:hypothetical protein